MKLYNTLTRQVDDFKPITASEVLLYSCGPTVYDYMHIGNLRKFTFDDVLRRSLEANGYNVKHAMNITDVGHLVSDDDEGEDKLEKGAIREGKTVWQVAGNYIKAFEKDMKLMNILPPNQHRGAGKYSRATDFIPQQIEMIELLLKNGHAYQTTQAIYFDVSKLADYGELTGQKLSDKEVGARQEVVTDQNKHHPQDFAVWFFTVERFAKHDMHWPSPWGEGFPGWHLECSAIIHTVLGDPIDIHTGGVDNIGTHHVNEMAQTEAAFGHRLANYWLHSEHLLVDERKMSKSQGNFYTLDDVIKKSFDPLALRLLFLQSHYRTLMNFSWDNLEAATNRLNDLRALADLRFQPNKDSDTQIDFDQYLSNIKAFLANDLDTPQMLATLSQASNQLTNGIGQNVHKEFLLFLELLDDFLGLDLLASKDIGQEQKTLIAKRQTARDSKDWQLADDLRGELEKSGVNVRDTDNGPIWSRIYS